MKICMLGSGSLGSALGGVLTEGGNDVYLIDAWPAHVEMMNARGLTLRSDGVDRTVKVKARTTADGIGPADLVVVLVKSFHTREAMTAARAIVGPETVVMSLQNGLGHEEILAEVVGKEHVVAGKTYAGGVLLGPGHVIAGTEGKLTFIGELDGRMTERATRIAATFTRAGLATEVSTNIMGTMWDKLLINVATGALSGITRLPYGGLYAVPVVHECSVAAVAEAIAVAKATGIKLTSEVPGRRLEARRRGPAEGIQGLDAAKHREGRAHGDRLHQRLGRAMGRTSQRRRRLLIVRSSPASRGSSCG